MNNKTRIIWRLEHKVHNIGPHWTQGKDTKLSNIIMHLCGLYYRDASHPVPEDDNCEAADDWENACYGAPSLKKLLHWFPPMYLKQLADCGFVVRRFRSNDYIIGVKCNQVVFDRNTAILVDENSPLDFT